MKKSALYLAAAVLVMAAGPALAQTTATSTTTTQPRAVEEVVVTAERREANIQDVPIAISAFSPSRLQDLGVGDTLAIAKFVPSLVGANNTGLGSANAYFLRGLGNTESIATFDPPVATYVDDVYVARQNANNYQLLDVERIEVLRGPQGTLFGRNTTGGAVSVIMKKPSTSFKAMFEVGIGSFDRATMRGSVDIPINDKILTKASAFVLTDTGFVENLTNGETFGGKDQAGGRLDLRFLPTQNLRWDLALEQTFDSGINIAATDSLSTTGGFTLPFVADPKGVGGGTTSTSPLFNKTRSGLRQGSCTGDLLTQWAINKRGNCNVNETTAITSNVQWSLDNFTINLISGRRELQQDFILDFFDVSNPFGGFVLMNNGVHEQTSHELKISGEAFGDRLSYVGGIFYLDETNETVLIDAITTTIPGLGLTPLPILQRKINNDTNSTAFYLQGDLKVTDALTLTLGARYTSEEKSIAYASPSRLNPVLGSPISNGGGANPALSLTTANLIAARIPTQLKEEKTTPRIAVRYDFSDDLNVFVSATNGFKSGGWNARSNRADLVTAFGPEEAWSYELGVRSKFFSRRATLNATLYRSDTESLQVITGLFPVGATTPTFLTQNAADLRVQGLEIEARYAFEGDFEVFGALALMDAEYTKTLDITRRINIDDEPVRTPDLQFNAGFSAGFSLGTAGRLRANGVLSYIGEYWVSTNNEQPIAFTGDYTLFNAGLTWETPKDGLTVSLTCSNCGDQEAVASWFSYAYGLEPRRIGLTLRYRSQ
jgi:iron complex outermembrane recepter protein